MNKTYLIPHDSLLIYNTPNLPIFDTLGTWGFNYGFYKSVKNILPQNHRKTTCKPPQTPMEKSSQAFT